MLDAETKEVLKEIQNIIQEADACLKRGNRYLDEGSPDLALAEFDRGIDIHPYGPELYISRSCAHLEKGDHAKALEDLDRSIPK